MSYWNNRAKQDLQALRRYDVSEHIADGTSRQIINMYKQGLKNVNDELNNVWRNYAEYVSKEKGEVVNVQQLKTLLSASETDKVWKQLEKQGLTKYIKKNYKARITRLEKIQAQLYAKVKLMAPKETQILGKGINDVINMNYYRTIYDVQQGSGLDFAFSKIGNKELQTITRAKWQGANYRDRVWFNNDVLAEEVSSIIGGGLLTGTSIEKMSDDLRKAFNVEYWKAERLARTEANYYHNRASELAYEEFNVKKYVFVATLDGRTSMMCRQHDNNKYDVDKIEVGVNYPPLHPNCRSTTRAYLSEEVEEDLKRRAVNPKTGELEIIKNQSYKDWMESNGMNIDGTKLTKENKININREESKTLINTQNNDTINLSDLNYNVKNIPEILNVDLNDFDIELEQHQERIAKGTKYGNVARRLNQKEYDELEGIEVKRIIKNKKKTIEKKLDDGTWVHNYKIVKAKDEWFNQLIDGELRFSSDNNSTYGRGIYFGTGISNLDTYKGRNGGIIVNAKISLESKIAKFKNEMDYISDLARRLKEVPKELQHFYSENKSLLYMLDGYDAIYIQNNEYFNVLNRSILNVLDKAEEYV